VWSLLAFSGVDDDSVLHALALANGGAALLAASDFHPKPHADACTVSAAGDARILTRIEFSRAGIALSQQPFAAMPDHTD
jgi:hypothetical protein